METTTILKEWAKEAIKNLHKLYFESLSEKDDTILVDAIEVLSYLVEHLEEEERKEEKQ